MGAENSREQATSQLIVNSADETMDDNMSERSVELGLDYPRIEYPKEVYDRVCGRLPSKHHPVSKKQKVEAWLSDSQSSQTTQDSSVSSKGRKRKKHSIPAGKQIVRKSRKGRLVKKIDYEEESIDSDAKESNEESRDESEIDSTSEVDDVLKPRDKSMKMKKVDKDYSCDRSVKWKDVKQSASDAEDEEERETKKHKEHKSDRIRDEKKEKKEKDTIKGTKIVAHSKERKNSSDSSREKHSHREERKEKEKDKEKKEQFHSKGGDKSADSGQEVRSNWTEGGTGSSPSFALPSKSSSDRAGSPSKHLSKQIHSSNKSILKKPATGAVPSDLAMLPSCVRSLYHDASSSTPTSSLASFKVPKKKETHIVHGLVGLPSPTEEKAGLHGYNPRVAAFVPPKRNFGKPLPKPAFSQVEKRRTSYDNSLPNGTPNESPTMPRSIIRPYTFEQKKRREEEDNEEWKKIMDGPKPSIIPFGSLMTSGQLEDMQSGFAEKATASTPPIVTPPSQNKSMMTKSSGNRGVSFSPNIQIKTIPPAPKWNERPKKESNIVKRRDEMMTPAWQGFDGFDSPESIERPKSRRSRWDHHVSPQKRATPMSPVSAMNLDTPLSPPPSATSTRNYGHSTSSIPTCIPIKTPPSITPTIIPVESRKVKYRFIPIDDEYLPEWNKSDRYTSRSATYAVSSPTHRCRAIVAVGPFKDTVDRSELERIVKGKGEADVEWTIAPASIDAQAMKKRTMAAVLCYEEKTAKALVEEGSIFVGDKFGGVGIPGEVLFSVEGIKDATQINEDEIAKEVTDELETNWGHLVEIMIYPERKGLVVEGKARFMQAVHASRAAHSAPLPFKDGRSIVFTTCPPDKKSIWIAQIYNENEDVKPVVVVPSISSSVPQSYSPPQPVPSPIVVSLSSQFGFKLKSEDVDAPSFSPSVDSLLSSAMSIETKEASSREELTANGDHHSSKFSSFNPPTAIPPPGLVDVATLYRLVKKEDPSMLYSQTISIPPISVPASLIPLPPTLIPPPIDVIPILPFPDLPPIKREFFPPPPPFRKKSQKLKTIDPSTFIKPFKSLLPPKEEVLLFVRPIEGENSNPIDWDAVTEYFKDINCCSRVYGGIVTLRFSGEKAKEKAQVLLLDAPYTVAGHIFNIGITHSCTLEASSAVSKTRLYEEVMEKFGSVVEVDKIRDSSNGKPVYKIHFDQLEKAQLASREGITFGGIVLTNVGGIPE